MMSYINYGQRTATTQFYRDSPTGCKANPAALNPSNWAILTILAEETDKGPDSGISLMQLMDRTKGKGRPIDELPTKPVYQNRWRLLGLKCVPTQQDKGKFRLVRIEGHCPANQAKEVSPADSARLGAIRDSVARKANQNTTDSGATSGGNGASTKPARDEPVLSGATTKKKPGFLYVESGRKPKPHAEEPAPPPSAADIGGLFATPSRLDMPRYHAVGAPPSRVRPEFDHGSTHPARGEKIPYDKKTRI